MTQVTMMLTLTQKFLPKNKNFNHVSFYKSFFFHLVSTFTQNLLLKQCFTQAFLQNQHHFFRININV